MTTPKLTPKYPSRLARMFRYELELLDDIRLWLRNLRRGKQPPPPPEVCVDVKGHQVRFDDASLPEGAPPASLAFAQSLVDRLDEIRLFSARQLLSLYNDQWRNDQEPPITADEFARRLVAPDITISEENSASIFFDPSGMFGEHYVLVWIDHGEPVDASMEG